MLWYIIFYQHPKENQRENQRISEQMWLGRLRVQSQFELVSASCLQNWYSYGARGMPGMCQWRSKQGGGEVEKGQMRKTVLVAVAATNSTPNHRESQSWPALSKGRETEREKERVIARESHKNSKSHLHYPLPLPTHSLTLSLCATASGMCCILKTRKQAPRGVCKVAQRGEGEGEERER